MILSCIELKVIGLICSFWFWLSTLQIKGISRDEETLQPLVYLNKWEYIPNKSSFFIPFFLWIILACYSTLWAIMCQLSWVFWTFCRLPETFSEGTRVFVVDPMLATGIYIITWAQTLSGLLNYFFLELGVHFMLVQWLNGCYVTIQISMNKLYCWLTQITRGHSYNLMKHILVTKM